MPGILYKVNNMDSILEKLKEEEHALEVKLAHLFTFIHVNPKFKELTAQEQVLLEKQYYYMCCYGDMLSERISIYEYANGKPIWVDYADSIY